MANIKARGRLIVGLDIGSNLFAFRDPITGEIKGFDADIAHQIAAAIFGDPSKIRFVATTGLTRFPALQSGEIDVLSRNTTWTMSRDTALGLDFAGVNYYDGQGFMVRKDLGVSSAKELDGATICIQTGTSTELNLADWFRANNMTYQPVNIDSNAEGEQQYMAGACDAYTTDASGLAGERLRLANSEDHIILPEIISKEPLGPAVRHGDDQWFDIVKWAHFAMLNAEELGVTKANVDDMAKSDNPDIKRLLGTEGKFGEGLGLTNDWAVRIIKQVGNYGEIFEKNVGQGSPLKIARGLNALWNKGGLQYAPPVR